MVFVSALCGRLHTSNFLWPHGPCIVVCLRMCGMHHSRKWYEQNCYVSTAVHTSAGSLWMSELLTWNSFQLFVSEISPELMTMDVGFRPKALPPCSLSTAYCWCGASFYCSPWTRPQVLERLHDQPKGSNQSSLREPWPQARRCWLPSKQNHIICIEQRSHSKAP